MQVNTIHDNDHYNELVARQVDQYKETEIMHDLPAIYNYWSQKHISEKGGRITGHDDIIDLYASYFQKSLYESDSIFLISVGAGDCSIEIEVAKRLISQYKKEFFFICLELSPILIERARKKIDEQGLGDVITVAQIDLNKWTPRYRFAGVMAHHSLHHILELEHLFGIIKNNLAPKGRFITCDIIGRNGHMRWPEALRLIREMWQRIPRKYKFNHQFKKYDEYFDNWDCSTEGFEGIRAQDILPLLIKMFSFEIFFSYGCLIDPFIDRAFDPNFSPENPVDTAFIDMVQELNEKLISDGILKPTYMTAIMVNDTVTDTKIYKNWSPAFSVRDPEAQAPAFDIQSLLKDIPYKVTPEDNPLVAKKTGTYTLGEKIFFTTGEKKLQPGQTNGTKFLTYGWGNPEPDFTWSMCEDAAIVLPLAEKIKTELIVAIAFRPYLSPLSDHTTIEVSVNNSIVSTLQLDSKAEPDEHELKINIPTQLIQDSSRVEISFRMPNRRQPQFESGSDIRPLGIALVRATVMYK